MLILDCGFQISEFRRHTSKSDPEASGLQSEIRNQYSVSFFLSDCIACENKFLATW